MEELGTPSPPRLTQTHITGRGDAVLCTEELEEDIKVGREGGRERGRGGRAEGEQGKRN